MKKAFTKGGSPCYNIKLDTIFTLQDFCRALSEESLSERIDFDNLKKRKAMVILKRRLEWNGRQGEFQNFDDIGDDTKVLNEEYDKAKQWVIKNYPYLNSTKTFYP